MRKTIVTLLAGTMLLSGCANFHSASAFRSYCNQKPAICILMGMVIVGGVIAIARNNRDKDHHDHHAVSDIRLKTDIRYVETLPNGVRLHAYKYRGDDRYFVGVLAQELLEDPKFADAVVTVDGGYLAVNYHKLGLELVNGQQMKAAGLKAISG